MPTERDMRGGWERGGDRKNGIRTKMGFPEEEDASFEEEEEEGTNNN